MPAVCRAPSSSLALGGTQSSFCASAKICLHLHSPGFRNITSARQASPRVDSSYFGNRPCGREASQSRSIVYHYTPRKRATIRQPTSNGPSLTDLPNELLLEILKHADTDTVTRFRLTCTSFTAAGNSELQRRLKTLYIHSTIPSLRRAVEICAHPLLSRDIEEVALLGKSLEDHSDFSRGWYDSGDLLLTRASMVWPSQFPRAVRGHVSSAAWDGELHGSDFASAYAPLVQALRNLAKLQKLPS